MSKREVAPDVQGLAGNSQVDLGVLLLKVNKFTKY